jgi:hypothetical protein
VKQSFKRFVIALLSYSFKEFFGIDHCVFQGLIFFWCATKLVTKIIFPNFFRINVQTFFKKIKQKHSNFASICLLVLYKLGFFPFFWVDLAKKNSQKKRQVILKNPTSTNPARNYLQKN